MSALDDAVAALAEAGVPPRSRKSGVASGRGYRELDLWLEPSDVSRTEAVLARHGFHRVRVAGHAPHLFFLTFREGLWLKIDAKVTRTTAVPRTLRKVMRRFPAGSRRYGPVVAVLGPDGAGKSTLLTELEGRLPLGVHVAYLGGKRRAAAHATAVARERSARSRRLVASHAGELAFVIRHLLRGARALLGVYTRAWRGTVVLCDRHPIEALAIDPRRTSTARLFERFVLRRIVPWPDVVVVLDAPLEVLYARKQEHPVERLAAWRERYRQVFAPAGARFIRTDAPPERTLDELATVVFETLVGRAHSS